MRHAVTALVAAACVAVAAAAYARFVPVSDQLWTSIHHDRNAHYVTSLQLASDLRSGQLHLLVKHLAALAVWPPGSYLPPALLLAAAGPDVRLAVLPSALAWALTGFVAFLLARRCLPAGGELAGVVAAAFVLASPIHHGFAVDVMIESTGTLLTLVCLYAYVVAAQDDTAPAWGRLGLSLTALLVTKYNYWLLVVLSLSLTELTRRGGVYLAWGRAALGRLDRAALAREWRHPLTVAIALLAVGALAVAWLKPAPVAGVRLSPPTNAFQLVYVLIVVRIARALRPWDATLAGLDGRARAAVMWHLVPAALFMALPRHATTFVWYVSPLNAPESRRSLAEGFWFYARVMPEGYHTGLAACVTALSLFAAGALLCRRMRPGALAVFVLALVSAVLTMKHPNHQERYAANWMPVVWVGAGLGVAGWLGLVTEGWRRMALVPASLVTAGVLACLVPGVVAGKRSAVAGPVEGPASQAGLARAIVAESRGHERVVVLGTTPVRFLAEWAVLEADGSTRRIEPRWFGFHGGGVGNVEGFRRWLEAPTSDVILVAEVPGEGADPVCESLVAPHREVLPLLESAAGFRHARSHDVGGLRLRVYERVDARQVRR